MKIGFIGGGNMAKAIIGGLVARDYPPSSISVSEPNQETCKALQHVFSSLNFCSNNDIVASCNVVILAVKPQILQNLLQSLDSSNNPVFISIAAGVLTTDIQKWLSKNGLPTVIRVMPNTPALVSEGASAMYAPSTVAQQTKDQVYEIVSAFSKCCYWVGDEDLLDIVTALSGSGPAYFFYVLEALESAAVALGLPRDIARGLAAQTCLGAGKMGTQNTDFAALRRNVTSPNGTTEAAIKVLDARGLKRILGEAVEAAAARSVELSRGEDV